MPHDCDWVVFDLGGVLVELDGAPVPLAWCGAEAETEVWARWLACPWVRRYERGGCSTDEFVAGLVRDWGLQVPAERFRDSFERWPVGLYPGALELLAELEGRVRRACFSNTNALHWESRFAPSGLAEALDRAFLSFAMQRVKPDRDAFAQLVAELGVPAERILFLDDNAVNVEGARAAGLRAERALGVEGCRAVLEARGLLGAGGAGS